MYILLPNKSFATYNRLFCAIKQLQPQFSPSEWMTDFETAAINAIRVNFPQVNVSGCFFHLQQCMWRKVQNLGLTNAYREDDGHFALCAKSLACLALVPIADVFSAFQQLVTSADFDSRIQPLVDYFERTWVGLQSASGARQEPLYAIKLWNIYDRVVNDERRTNNNIEGWHRRFQSVLQCSRPTVFKCINALRLEQKRNEDEIARLVAGELPPPQKKKYRDLNRRIKGIVSGYDVVGRSNIVRYLHGLAHNCGL